MRAIITFHSLDNRGTVLSYPPAQFAHLLEALDHAGLPVVDLDTLLAEPDRDAVVLNFDDGFRSVHESALPLLREHRVPSHLFLTTASIGRDNRWPTQPAGTPRYDMLNWDQLTELRAADMQVEAHTHSHADLRRLDVVAAIAECEQADTLIETHLGRRPRYFAWPYGHVNDTLQPALAARYNGMVTTVMRVLRSSDQVTALPRLDAYYLQNTWLIDRLVTWQGQTWLKFRHWLRRLRGGR